MTGVYDSTGATRKAAFTWDALGRRVESWNDVQFATTRYWYDGVNPLTPRRLSPLVLRTANAAAFADASRAGEVHRYRLACEPGSQAHTPHVFIHGVSYIDERLAMIPTVSNKPYYFVVDRMYNVRMLIDRAGAVVERYAYDSYGRPRIRESCGRGDLNDDTLMTSTDTSRFTSAKHGVIWDPRADMDDDGDVDANDQTLYDAKQPDWASALDATAVVAQAFSDADNPFMFQGVPHFAIETQSNATEDKLSLNHHRARFVDCPTGRWTTRDPITYNAYVCQSSLIYLNGQYHRTLVKHARRQNIRRKPFDLIPSSNTTDYLLFRYLGSNPTHLTDSSGLSVACLTADPVPPGAACNAYPTNSTYANFGQRCMCNCTPDSETMNLVRGCLLCMYRDGVDPADAHIACYDAVSDSVGELIEFGMDVVCPCLECATTCLTYLFWSISCSAAGY